MTPDDDDVPPRPSYRPGSLFDPLHYHNPRFVDRCVHPRDGVTDDDAARCIAILRGEVTP